MDNVKHRSGYWTLGVATLCLVLAFFYSLNPLASGAERYAAKVSAASAGTYVSLRTLNAFLSTAQEAEVSASIGVGGSVQPLKFLEPIDDTIERIAGVVFAMMIASGVLSVAMAPTGGVGFAMIAFGLFCLWRLPAAKVGRKLVIYGAFFALALPLSYAASGQLTKHMTDKVWEENEKVVEEMTAVIEVAEQPKDDDGWFATIRDKADIVGQYSSVASNILANADKLIASYVKLLAVLLFNLIVLPIVLTGGVFIIFRWMANERVG